MKTYNLIIHLNELHVYHPEQKWCYIRSCKAGSTSIVNELQEIYGKQLKRDCTVMHDPSYTFFSSVRNPYSRFLSLCNMFGYEPERLMNELKNNGTGVSEKVIWHCLPMNTFIPDYAECIHMEDIQKDWENIAFHVLGIEARKLPHLNKSKKTWIELPDRVREFVADYYFVDFIAFGYNR